MSHCDGCNRQLPTMNMRTGAGGLKHCRSCEPPISPRAIVHCSSTYNPDDPWDLD